VGLNYVSCSPFRVPIARLAAAHAAIASGPRRPRLLIAIGIICILVACLNALIALIGAKFEWDGLSHRRPVGFAFLHRELFYLITTLALTFYLCVIGVYCVRGRRDARWHCLWFIYYKFATAVFWLCEAGYIFMNLGAYFLQWLRIFAPEVAFGLVYPTILFGAMNFPSIRRYTRKASPAPENATPLPVVENVGPPPEFRPATALTLRYAQAETEVPSIVRALGMLAFFLAWMQLSYGSCLANTDRGLRLLNNVAGGYIVIASELSIAAYFILTGVLFLRGARSARRHAIWYSILGILFAVLIFTVELSELFVIRPVNAMILPDSYPWRIAGQLLWNLWMPVLMLSLAFLPRVREYYRSTA
jgi:hypothetical protein